MGRKSREKRERREEETLNAGSKRILKQMIRESSPDVFMNSEGNATFYNPLKRTLKGEKYNSDEGQAVVQEMVKQYENILRQRYNAEKLAKNSGINMEEVDKL